MRILKIEPEPADRVPYRSALTGGGSAIADLPVYAGLIEGLPPGLDALVVASDLQGVCEAPGSGPRLLGEELAERLALLLEYEFPRLEPRRTLALLCGDLYADPEVRGSSGDPLPVWRAFARAFGAACGVAGNHDLLPPGGEAELDACGNAEFFGSPGVRDVSGIALAGLGGIVGREGRPNRMPEERFLREVDRLLARRPDVLLLHQGPSGQGGDRRGHEELRRRLEAGPPLLVCCGHIHWKRPLAELGQAQVLNADGRAFVFTRA
ncbi:hypothetical protein CDO73_16035 [Saccharibacillus sp. O23]|uniref:metallophosphoesterase family protein n=1 Tax=Saccharibacillus sp. O23 TaxID=2009338 RepID=UPI000B4E494F|nr:metallophosphoesterase [Saccharibacillus sp. O23]OWR29171.1 hypothetical protein CDO73_16035 [Saccharibacillus sp. O23]